MILNFYKKQPIKVYCGNNIARFFKKEIVQNDKFRAVF